MKSVYFCANKGGGESDTYLRGVFKALENKQKDYQWLISDIDCYPQNERFWRMTDQKYCWISGEELTEMIDEEDFQWVWATFSAFDPQTTLMEVLQYPLPECLNNYQFYIDYPQIQHPLAEMEIDAIDSSYTLFFSKDPRWAEKIMHEYPSSKDLQLKNQRYNALIKQINLFVENSNSDLYKKLFIEQPRARFQIASMILGNVEGEISDEMIERALINEMHK